MKQFKRFLPDLVWTAVFLLLPLALYHSVTFGSLTIIPTDNLAQWAPWKNNTLPHNNLISDLLLENYVWKQFLQESLAQKEIPLWNPHLFAGAPFLATGQNAAYYPFGLIFLFLPLPLAYGWFAFSQIWLAALFTYLGGRLWGISRSGAGIAGLIFQGCGFMLVSAAVFPMIISAAIWLPLLLGCLYRIIQESTSPTNGRLTPWITLTSFALGMQILAGHIEITYYTLLVMGAYTAWKLLLLAWSKRQDGLSTLIRTIARPAASTLAVVLIGLMLGGIQFIPFYEVGATNFRDGSATFTEVQSWAFPPRRILTLLLPNFFGAPSHHTYTDLLTSQSTPLTSNYYGTPNPHGAGTTNWGIKNYVEGGIYLGFLPLILALLGCWQWLKKKERRPELTFLIGSSILSLSFIFGTPLYALLYYGLPGINQLHSPFRWIFPLSLFIAWLAGFGIDYLQERKRPFPYPYLLLLLSTIPLISLSSFRIFVRNGMIPLNQGFLEHIFINLAQAPDAFPNALAFYSYLFPQLFTLALILFASGLILVSLHRFPAKQWITATFLLIACDLFLASNHFHTTADPSLLAHTPPSITWLQQQPGNWRLTSFDDGSQPLHANTPWMFGLQDIRGYDSIIAKQYVQYMQMIESQEELPYNRIQPLKHWESINSPWLDLLGVQYIVSAIPLELPKLSLAYQDDQLLIYENLAVAPRAFTLPTTAVQLVPDHATMSQFDPRQYLLFFPQDLPSSYTPPANPTPAKLQPATITQATNIEMIVQTTVTEPSWLVLTDSYFPGWKLFVRSLDNPNAPEVESSIQRVDGNFRATQLAPGSWELRFRYSPTTFKLGGLTSFMGGIIILFSLLVWSWKRWYNPDAELTNTRSIAKNSVVPMILNLFNRGIDFVFAAFYLRLLGPADAGGYATAIAITGWFDILSNFGLNTLLIREISQDKSRASHLLLNSSFIRLGTTVLGLIPVLLYIWQFPMRPEILFAIGFITIGMVLSGLSQGLAGLFYAYEEAEIPAMVSTITTILKVGFGVLVLLLNYSFVGLAAVSILVNLITLIILTRATFKRYPLNGPWRLDFPLQKTILKQGYPLMINHLFAVIFFQIDVPILQQYHGDETVGWYNSAYKWINAFNVIPSFFTFALFPVISRQLLHSLKDAQRTFEMGIKLMLLISLPLAVFITFTAHWLISLLGGAAFLPHGAIALQIVIWSIPFGWLNSVTNYVLISLGQERLQTWAFLAGVSFNLIANLIFIPRFSYVAAGITTILSEIILLLIFNYYLKEKMPDVRWLKLGWRPLLASLFMFATTALLSIKLPLIIALLAGLLVYPLSLWQLKIIGPDEQKILRSILPPPLLKLFKLTE